MTKSTAELAGLGLRRIAGAGAAFRSGQLDAIEALVRDRRRVLLVQRTGWGKSAVYLIATELLRREGYGATVIVSPLIALMRNQVEMAKRLGLEAETVNSSNREDWDTIFESMTKGTLDLVLISPERLNNPEFRTDVLPDLIDSTGLLVIDEVHCISDWGHDFRPDYRRLAQIVSLLPPGIPVLGATATANDRVIRDVREQLGEELLAIRGTLERESLALQVIHLPHQADRLAWLAGVVPTLRGSGIVYCLTVRDSRRVAQWLQGHDIRAVSYTGQDESDERLAIEGRLSSGDVKVVVATSALAMGYDNPKIQFVIHYQSPGSPVAYYQQVGRAGRAVDRSFGVLLAGEEDVEIQDYFIRTAFPSESDVVAVLDALEAGRGLSRSRLESVVNVPAGRIGALLKVLEVERAVYREGAQWFRSAERWEYPHERVRLVAAARGEEQRAMRIFVESKACLMMFLRSELDDPGAARCGRCANCVGDLFPETPEPALVGEAQRFVKRGWTPILPRRRWPAGIDAPSMKDFSLAEGRALSVWGDTGWADAVREGKYQRGRFGDDLVAAVVEMLRAWDPLPSPSWVAYVPGRDGHLVEDAARRVAAELGIAGIDVVRRVRPTHRQKLMHNSFQQANNVHGAFEIDGVVSGAGILFDDIIDSRWTVTEIGMLLRLAGADTVYPVALADASRGDR